jgi:hypothetical protein
LFLAALPPKTKTYFAWRGAAAPSTAQPPTAARLNGKWSFWFRRLCCRNQNDHSFPGAGEARDHAPHQAALQSQ